MRRTNIFTSLLQLSRNFLLGILLMNSFILSAQGARLMEEGRELATEEENLVALRALVQSFEKKRRPILESLQIM